MTNEQLMMLGNAGLVAVLGFFIKMWINDLKQANRDIWKKISEMDQEKMDAKTCEIHHAEIKKRLHVHGVLGQAGEVIPQ